MRSRLFLLLSLLASLSSHADRIELDCATRTLLEKIAVDHVKGQDEVLRRTKPETSLQIPFRAETFSPLTILATGGEAQIVTVLRNQEVQILKRFYSPTQAVRYVAGMNQFRDLGVAAAEILAVDFPNKTVAVKNYRLFSPDWVYQEALPAGEWSRLIRLRRQFADKVEDIGFRHGLLDKRLVTSNILLDLDTEQFLLIDIE